MTKDLTGFYYTKLVKALSYLEFTYNRVRILPVQLSDGAFRDYLNRAHKLGLIDETESWLLIRDLRNVAVHEYSEGDLEKILTKFLRFTPMILDLRKRLAHATDKI